MTAELIRSDHTDRLAIVYVRQSEPAQVLKHTGSADWQRSLSQTAVSLGWPPERVVIVEEPGVSSAFGTVRKQFRHLLTLVRTFQVGVVMVVDQTRSARNDADWGLLVELMAQTNTLMYCDEQVFDPNNFLDRLNLSLSQALAIADTQQLRERMRESTLAKARAGTLKTRLPVGYVHRRGQPQIDDTPGVRDAIQGIFDTFDRLGSVRQVAKHYLKHGLNVPHRYRESVEAANHIRWGPPTVDSMIRVLKNPTYAGIYTYGRSQTKTVIHDDYSASIHRPDQPDPATWYARIENAFEGFISATQFEQNQARIRANNRVTGGPPGSGKALLQGIAFCGMCGRRLSINYPRQGQARFVCPSGGNHAAPGCQGFANAPVEKVVVASALAALSAAQVDLTLRIHEQLMDDQVRTSMVQTQTLQQAKNRQEDAFQLLKRALARHSGETLLADLEREWQQTRSDVLARERDLVLAQEYRRTMVTPEQEQALRSLTANLERVWHDPATGAADRKRLLRCLIASVVIRRETNQLHVVVQWHSKQTTSLTIPVRASKTLQRDVAPTSEDT